MVARAKNANWGEWIGWPAWLIVCFLVTLLASGLVTAVVATLGFRDFLNGTLGSIVLSAVIYVILVGLIVGITRITISVKLRTFTGNGAIVAGAVLAAVALYVLHLGSMGAYVLLGVATGLLFVFANIPPTRRAVTPSGLGVQRPMSWADIGLGMAGYVIYFLTFVAITVALSKLVPAYNPQQAQDIGFTALYGLERTVGFIVLVVVTPLAEELVMRGFLFGKLRESKMPFWPAAVVVSVIFGFAHGQWNVGVDTFILSMVACYLRELTGTIWPGVVIHMLKNALAYIMLFVFLVR